MSIKYKHCCIINDFDYIEVDRIYSENAGIEVVKVYAFDSNTNSDVEIHLDKKTAIRFAKSVRTEINKIQ